MTFLDHIRLTLEIGGGAILIGVPTLIALSFDIRRNRKRTRAIEHRLVPDEPALAPEAEADKRAVTWGIDRGNYFEI